MARRLLNIASIVCLVACVALMGLWVRSYLLLDSYSIHLFNYFIGIASEKGRLCFDVSTDAALPLSLAWVSSRVWNQPLQAWGKFGFYFGQYGDWTSLYFPYWFAVLMSGSLAMISRLRWPPQFNLRSLFIAMTFLAIVLGMTAWLDRAWIGK